MTIKEMEVQIDRLGLEKLEVRLWMGNQVDVFICAIKDDEEGEFDDENQHRGNIVVFDGHGKCYETTPLALRPREMNLRLLTRMELTMTCQKLSMDMI